MFPKLQELVYGGHFLNAVQNRVDSTNIRPQLSNQEREQIKENIQRMYPLHLFSQVEQSLEYKCFKHLHIEQVLKIRMETPINLMETKFI